MIHNLITRHDRSDITYNCVFTIINVIKLKMNSCIIKSGDYVIVQRQGYTKLHKMKAKGNLTMGSFLIEVNNVVGEKYETMFQMKPKPNNIKLYALEKVEELTTISQLNIESSGKDNRHITDDGTSQTMTKEEITKLKDESLSSADIVGKLINNSKTFNSKTEYSQEKYMKKKEKKYFEYIQFRKPSIRLLVQMFYRQEPAKVLGLRIDDLSQILTYGNVQSNGSFILYDSGTSGLMTAAMLNTIGANNEGSLIHMHPGNECQKNAVLAMQFPQEQLERCINVNIYSVLRCYYQEKDSYSETGEKSKVENLEEENTIKKIKLDEEATCSSVNTENKETVSQSSENSEVVGIKQVSENNEENKLSDVISESEKSEQTGTKRKLSDDTSDAKPKKPCWQFDNEKACRILKNKVDGLIVTCKEHPVNIVKELVPFLKGSRSFVVFHLMREPLEELYVHLKSRCDFISLRLSNNFLRNYQVLLDRTHPEVNMSSGGYILSGFKLG